MVELLVFDGAVAERLQKVESEDAAAHGFMAAVENFRKTVANAPHFMDVRVKADWTDPALSPDPGMEVLLDLENWFSFLLASPTYRAVNTADDIISGFNERRYARAASAARSLLEQAAWLEHIWRLMEAYIARLREVSTSNPSTGLEIMGEMRHAFVREMQKGRLDWAAWTENPAQFFALGNWEVPDGDERRATNILTLVGKLKGWNPPAMASYALLSEFSHPNIGTSYLLMGATDGDPEGWHGARLTLRPDDPATLDWVAKLVCPAVTNALPVLENRINGLAVVASAFSGFASAYAESKGYQLKRCAPRARPADGRSV